MVKKMLVDANHPEETRVVVVSGAQLDGFDIETASRKQNKGNIYLAKVIRVEPSLQAAFVDYGGNRNGFLAFTEIHPDYFQIPVADKEALLSSSPVTEDLDPKVDENKISDSESLSNTKAEEEPKVIDNSVEIQTQIQTDQLVEELGGEDESEDSGEAHNQKILTAKKYKIQEVIKRRQILLVQVSKEERGNKGAALTTYLSLAGRYCVLMPNNHRGGGISRKITNLKDRRRLKLIISELEVSEQMGVILRTAGSERSKAEIKRDYDYLLRTWNQIRNRTMQSRAPEMIHEEANLIKRSIRDVYSKDIDEIIVEGEKGYKAAKDFMRLLTPSHAKKIKRYKYDNFSLFQKYGVESQLDEINNPIVHLDSGGSIVFGQTEALVAIDVNSGKSTKERHIEETALKTNLEAAEEIARQLRLRDLAGLVVIDFIDMEGFQNNQNVEKKLKESLRVDRAKIQVGRISHFGLLELSRQRLRPSLIETQFETCSNCNGTGITRSIESTAIQILRELEQEILRNKAREIVVSVSPDVAIYILNFKRSSLEDYKKRLGSNIIIEADTTLIPPQSKIRNNIKDEKSEIKITEDQRAERSNLENLKPDDTLTDKDHDKRKKRRRRKKPRVEKNDTDDQALIKITSPINNDNKENINPIKPNDIDKSENNNVSEIHKDIDQSKKYKKREWRGKNRWRKKPRNEKTDVILEKKVEDINKKVVNNQSNEISSENQTTESKDKKEKVGFFAAFQKSAQVIKNTVVDNKANVNKNEKPSIKKDITIPAKKGWWSKKE